MEIQQTQYSNTLIDLDKAVTTNGSENSPISSPDEFISPAMNTDTEDTTGSDDEPIRISSGNDMLHQSIVVDNYVNLKKDASTYDKSTAPLVHHVRKYNADIVDKLTCEYLSKGVQDVQDVRDETPIPNNTEHSDSNQ